MKKFIVLLITAILIVSMFGVLTAFAGSASISISNIKTVEPGHTYTYKVTVNVSDAGSAMANMSCSGIFTLVSTADIPDFFKSSNGSGYVSGSITVKVRSDAKSGDTGTIRVSGQLGTWSSTGSIEEKSISKNLTAEVGTPSSGSEPRTAAATKAPTEWDIAAANVEAMPSGGAITLDIKDDPKLPVSLLSSVKEKQGTLTINFGGYTCTLDGKVLGSMPEGVNSIDLSMKTDRDETFSAAVGGKDAYQLHFACKGQLPGKISYSFKAANNKPGDILYLYYYYDQPGICEGIQSAAVDSNGYVTFDIYHCSSYFVSASAVEGASGVDFKSEAALREAEESKAQLQTQLEDARDSSEELQSEVDTLKSEIPPEKNPLTASVSAPFNNLFGVPYGSLIAALLGTALVSMFLTMLICKVGIFGKKAKDKAEI